MDEHMDVVSVIIICAVCANSVLSRQQVIKCEQCERPSHRKCTTVSQTAYRAALKYKRTNRYLCPECEIHNEDLLLQPDQLEYNDFLDNDNNLQDVDMVAFDTVVHL